MRARVSLTTKFILAALGIVCAVLAGSAAVSIGRERALFENDMTHDAQVLAKALAVPLVRAWRAGGPHAARTLMAQVQAQSDGVRVGWE